MTTDMHVLRFDLPDDWTVRGSDTVIPLTQGILRKMGLERSEFDVSMKKKKVKVELKDVERIDMVIQGLQASLRLSFVPKMDVFDADDDEQEPRKEIA